MSDISNLAETDSVGFDGEDYAVHKVCGARLLEEWEITRYESYAIKRNGRRVFTTDDPGLDRECDGVWCDKCAVEINVYQNLPYPRS